MSFIRSLPPDNIRDPASADRPASNKGCVIESLNPGRYQRHRFGVWKLVLLSASLGAQRFRSLHLYLMQGGLQMPDREYYLAGSDG